MKNVIRVVLVLASLSCGRACFATDLTRVSIELDDCHSANYFVQNTRAHFIPGCMEKQRTKLEKLIQKGGDPFWLDAIARDLIIFYFDNRIQTEPLPLLIRSRFDVYEEALRRGALAANQVGTEKRARKDDTVRWMRDLAKDKAEEDYFAALDSEKYRNEIKSLKDDYKLTDRLLNPKAPSAWATILLAAAQSVNNTPYVPQTNTSSSPPPPIAATSTVGSSYDCGTPCNAKPDGVHQNPH